MKFLMPVVVLIVCLLGLGCSSPPRSSSRMTPEDYQSVATQTAEKFSDSLFLAERSPESPQMVIVMSSVENLTSDVIPIGEQWYAQARVVNLLAMTDLARQKNIAFIIPAERLRQAQRHGPLDDHFTPDRQPTHVMAAVYRSITRSEEKASTVFYQCEYQIIDFDTREVVWADAVEFKRKAFGSWGWD